jgi:hypothetical protein
VFGHSPSGSANHYAPPLALWRSMATRKAGDRMAADPDLEVPRGNALSGARAPSVPPEVAPVEGKTLEDALLTWGDPAAVTEMVRLAREGYHGPAIIVLGVPETEAEQKIFRYRSLREQLKAELLANLRQGKLVAAGFDARAAIDARPVTVPADRWRVLTPNYVDSSATGPGITIAGILVTEPTATAATAPATEAVDEGPVVEKIGPKEPRLRMWKSSGLVQLDGTAVILTHRSFRLLLKLAESAAIGAALVRLAELRKLVNGSGDKAVAQGVHVLKGELEKSGVEADRVKVLIENRRAAGYWLNMSSSNIKIND